MRKYYSLVILNVAVNGSLATAMLRHIVKRNLSVVLVVELALIVTTYLIVREVAPEVGTSPPENTKVRIAWITGPLFAGWLPVFIYSAIKEPDVRGILQVFFAFLFALTAWVTALES